MAKMLNTWLFRQLLTQRAFSGLSWKESCFETRASYRIFLLISQLKPYSRMLVVRSVTLSSSRSIQKSIIRSSLKHHSTFPSLTPSVSPPLMLHITEPQSRPLFLQPSSWQCPVQQAVFKPMKLPATPPAAAVSAQSTIWSRSDFQTHHSPSEVSFFSLGVSVTDSSCKSYLWGRVSRA